MKVHATEVQKFTFDHIKSEASLADADSSAPKPKATLANRDAEEDLHRKTGDISLYSMSFSSCSYRTRTHGGVAYYLKAAGIWNAILLVACTAIYSFSVTFTQYWFKWWTSSETDRTTFYVLGYILIAIVAWVSTNGIMS